MQDYRDLVLTCLNALPAILNVIVAFSDFSIAVGDLRIDRGGGVTMQAVVLFFILLELFVHFFLEFVARSTDLALQACQHTL